MRGRSAASGCGGIAELCDRASRRAASSTLVDGGRRVPILASPAGGSGFVKERLTAARCLRIMSRCYQEEKRGSCTKLLQSGHFCSRFCLMFQQSRILYTNSPGNTILERLCRKVAVARFLSHSPDRTWFSGPSSAPTGATSPSASGSAAPDGSGRKIRSRSLSPTAEAGSCEACPPLDPAAGSEGNCEAAFPPIGGMPLRNDEWKAPPSQPAPPPLFSGSDGIRCTRRCAG